MDNFDYMSHEDEYSSIDDYDYYSCPHGCIEDVLLTKSEPCPHCGEELV